MSTKAETIKTKTEENPFKQQEKAAKERVSRKRRLNWLLHLGFGIFCAACVAIVTIVHFFVGVGKVFDITFSFPAIVEWLTFLPELSILAPEEQLSKLIVGFCFFLGYFAVSINLIINLICVIRQVSLLHEAKYGKINAKNELFKAFEATSISYCSVFLFGLLASTSEDKKLSFYLCALFVLYGVFFVLATIKNNISLRQILDKENFKKRHVVWDTVKDFLLVVFAALLVVTCLQSQLYVFIQNIKLNFQTLQRFKGLDVIVKFVLPALQFFLAVTCVLLFKQTILITKEKRKTEFVSFYGNIYQLGGELTPFQKQAKRRMKWMIFLSCICCLLSVLPAVFNGKTFFLPQDVKALIITHLCYPITIALAVVTYFLLKRKENRFSKAQEVLKEEQE